MPSVQPPCLADGDRVDGGLLIFLRAYFDIRACRAAAEGEGKPMQPIMTHPLIDEILDEHRARWPEGDEVGWSGYRNHAQRVFIFARHLAEPRQDAEAQLAIAAAFHDISVFRTLDYLAPNIQALQAWLAANGRPEWHREITLAMTLHHRVRPYRGEAAWLAEPLRRADWIEVTAGLVHPGVPTDLVRQAQRELPMGTSFTTKTALRIGTHAITHPHDPMPFWRSQRALHQLDAAL